MTKAAILEKADKEKRTLLTEIESKEWLKAAGIPTVETKLSTTKTVARLYFALPFAVKPPPALTDSFSPRLTDRLGFFLDMITPHL